MQEYDATSLLRKVKSKTKIILGKQDPVIEAQEAKKFDQIEFSSSEYIANGGHFVPLTQPFLFNRLLTKFLNE